MKVTNLISNRSGKAVANQFVIVDGQKTYFQSYKSTIVKIDGETQLIVIGKHWNYSQTTRKHLYNFLKQYAPLVYFPWNKNNIEHLFTQGTFKDIFGRDWTIAYSEYLI